MVWWRITVIALLIVSLVESTASLICVMNLSGDLDAVSQNVISINRFLRGPP